MACPPGTAGSLLTGGWSVDNVITLSAGQPVNINYMFENDFNGSSEFYGRGDLVGNPLAGTSAFGSGYFINQSAFAVPCNYDASGTYGCFDKDPNQHFGNVWAGIRLTARRSRIGISRW